MKSPHAVQARPAIARVTYIKFLEMLLAALPDREYKADVGSWSRAIYHLKNRYGKEYPELFDRFEFIERDPAAPHSDQVNYFLRIEQEADLIRVYNPSFEKLQIPAESKQTLQARHAELLEHYSPAVQQFVDEIARFVTIDQRDGEPTERTRASFS